MAYLSNCVINSPSVCIHQTVASRRDAATMASWSEGRMRITAAISDCHFRSSVTSRRKALRSDFGSRRRNALTKLDSRISSGLGGGKALGSAGLWRGSVIAPKSSAKSEPQVKKASYRAVKPVDRRRTSTLSERG